MCDKLAPAANFLYVAGHAGGTSYCLTKAVRAAGFHRATLLFRDAPEVERNLPEQIERQDLLSLMVTW